MKNHTLSLLEKKLQAIIDSNKCKFNEDDQDSSDGEAEESCKDNKLTIKYTIMQKMPLEISKLLSNYFQKVMELSIINCDLRTFENFPKLENLKNINVCKNSLKGSFEFLVKNRSIKYIDASQNLISDIKKFDPLRCLKNVSVYVKENPFLTKSDSLRSGRNSISEQFKNIGVKFLDKPLFNKQEKIKKEEKTCKLSATNLTKREDLIELFMSSSKRNCNNYDKLFIRKIKEEEERSRQLEREREIKREREERERLRLIERETQREIMERGRQRLLFESFPEFNIHPRERERERDRERNLERIEERYQNLTQILRQNHFLPRQQPNNDIKTMEEDDSDENGVEIDQYGDADDDGQEEINENNPISENQSEEEEEEEEEEEGNKNVFHIEQDPLGLNENGEFFNRRLTDYSNRMYLDDDSDGDRQEEGEEREMAIEGQVENEGDYFNIVSEEDDDEF